MQNKLRGIIALAAALGTLALVINAGAGALKKSEPSDTSVVPRSESLESGSSLPGIPESSVKPAENQPPTRPVPTAPQTWCSSIDVNKVIKSMSTGVDMVSMRQGIVNTLGIEVESAGFHIVKPRTPMYHDSLIYDGRWRDYYHIRHQYYLATGDLMDDGTNETVPVTMPLSYATAFASSILPSPDVTTDPDNTGKHRLEVTLDASSSTALLDLIGGEVIASAPKCDWAGFGIDTGEAVADMRVVLVSNNRCHKPWSVNDAVAVAGQYPTIVIADNLTLAEANQIVQMLP